MLFNIGKDMHTQRCEKLFYENQMKGRYGCLSKEIDEKYEKQQDVQHQIEVEQIQKDAADFWLLQNKNYESLRKVTGFFLFCQFSENIGKSLYN